MWLTIARDKDNQDVGPIFLTQFMDPWRIIPTISLSYLKFDNTKKWSSIKPLLLKVNHKPQLLSYIIHLCLRVLSDNKMHHPYIDLQIHLIKIFSCNQIKFWYKLEIGITHHLPLLCINKLQFSKWMSHCKSCTQTPHHKFLKFPFNELRIILMLGLFYNITSSMS